MTTNLSGRRPALVALLALSLGILAAALLGPSQTLAQTRRSSCAGITHARAVHGTHVCPQPSNTKKPKAHTRHTAKPHGHHTAAGKVTKGKRGAAAATAPALCEDASTPVRTADGSFSCDDGSEPACEDGATPTRSANGRSLVCALADEGESGSGTAECEEEDQSACAVGSGSDGGEPACEANGEASSEEACEAED